MGPVARADRSHLAIVDRRVVGAFEEIRDAGKRVALETMLDKFVDDKLARPDECRDGGPNRADMPLKDAVGGV